MRITNMTSSNGREVPNQLIIQDGDTRVFQSYSSVIVRETGYGTSRKVELDRDKWDYSQTTGAYRNQFLSETKAETQKKIDSGEYILTNLN